MEKVELLAELIAIVSRYSLPRKDYGDYFRYVTIISNLVFQDKVMSQKEIKSLFEQKVENAGAGTNFGKEVSVADSAKILNLTKKLSKVVPQDMYLLIPVAVIQQFPSNSSVK
jgi:putative copper export protein